VVLHGLGGVGKSQLAVEYAHAHRGELAVVWAARADNVSVLTADLAALSVAVGAADPSRADIEIQLTAVRAWLSSNPRWLIIIDNADDPAVVSAVHRLLPDARAGRVIVTSRISAWPGQYRQLEIPVLSVGQAAELLMQRVADADQETAESLAEELGCLPLALQQAAAYCQQNGKTLVGYLALFRDARRQARLLSTGGDEGETVTATWTVSVRQVSSDDPAAATLLDILAYFAPDAIPRSLLSTATEGSIISRAAGKLDPLASLRHADELTLDQALGVLHRYSLVQLSTEAITVHRLVQMVIRASHPLETRDACVALAASLIREALPPLGYLAWPAYEALLPHAMAVFAHLADDRTRQQDIDLLALAGSNRRDHVPPETSPSIRPPAPAVPAISPASQARYDILARRLPYGPLARLADITAGRRDGRAGVPQLPAVGQQPGPVDPRLGTTSYLEVRIREFKELAERERERALTDLVDVRRRRAEIQARLTAAEERAGELRTRLEHMLVAPAGAPRRDALELRLAVPDQLVRMRREQEFLHVRGDLVARVEEAESVARELRAEDASLAEVIAARDAVRDSRVRQLLEHTLRRCETYMRHVVYHHPDGSALIPSLRLGFPGLPEWLNQPPASGGLGDRSTA
jgi:hypothetical protein